MRSIKIIVAVLMLIGVTNALAQGGPPGGGGGGGGGGDKVQLSDLGCGPGEIARVNTADEWECSPELSVAETDIVNAQSTADTALLNAATAQSTANAALSAAGAAQATADAALTNAASAQTTAVSTVAAAANAQSTADGAVSAAAAAQSTADSAHSYAGALDVRLRGIEGLNLDARVTALEIEASVANVATIAIQGGDYTSITEALENIDTGDVWCGTPSLSNPCLVKVMPGDYAIPLRTILPSHVHLKGSGRGVSVLTVVSDSSSQPGLWLSDSTSVSDLSIFVPGESFHTGIYINGRGCLVERVAVATPKDNFGREGITITNLGEAAIVEVFVDNFTRALENNGGSADLFRFENTVSGVGVLVNNGGTATISESIIRNIVASSSQNTGTGLGVIGLGSKAEVRSSEINVISTSDSGYALISGSLIRGLLRDTNGPVPSGTIEILHSRYVDRFIIDSSLLQSRCVLTVDENLTELGPDCRPL